MATDQPPNDPSAAQSGDENTRAPQAHGASATPPPLPYGKPPGEYDAQHPGYQEAPQGYQQAPQGYQQGPQHGYQQPQGYYQQTPQAPGAYQQAPPPAAYPQGYPQGAAGPYYGFPEPKSRLAAGLLAWGYTAFTSGTPRWESCSSLSRSSPSASVPSGASSKES